MSLIRWIRSLGVAAGLVAAAQAGHAAGGYFALGYGPTARGMAGATTAYGQDAFAGASNPAKWLAAGNRVDAGLEIFMPYVQIERHGASNPLYDIDTASARDIFYIPEGAISRRINDRLAWGLTVYGNGGLDTTYRATTRVPGTNFAPAACGNRPANFLFGCGKLGFDLMQVVFAPGLAYEVAPGQTVGIAPLFAAQRFKAYGLQAFDAFSAHPGDVSNRGYDWALGAGVRVGWTGHVNSWLTLGAAWASKVYMGEFEQYDGLIAGGSFDIPSNYSVGLAAQVLPTLVATLDFQRIEFGHVPAVGNGVLNTLLDPAGSPLGGRHGSGFNWGNQNNLRAGLEYTLSPAFVLRGGYAYGSRVQRDDGMNSVTFNMFTPNPEHQASAGVSWRPDAAHELNVTYARFIAPSYAGPSASALLGIGGVERIHAHVDAVMVGWSWKQ